MKASIKNIVLPDAPAPTRAVYKKPVVGTYAPGMRVIEIPSVYHPKPAPIPKHRKKSKVKKLPKERKPRASFWTPENEEKLIQMYKAGVMYDEMAKVFRMSRGGVAARVQILVNQGRLDHRLVHNAWTDEDLSLLYEMRAAGKSYGEISDRIGRSAKACNEMYRRTYG